MPKKILFVYNQVTEEERNGFFGECTLVRDVEAIRQGLDESNNQILSLDLFTPDQLSDFIKKHQPIDLAFVIAEGFKGLPQTLYNGHGAALVRKHLMKHHIPCTHSDFESMEVCRNKDITYAKLREKGVLVPEYMVFDTNFLGNIDRLFLEVEKIGYPLMIKPAGGGNSLGISSKSVVYNFLELKEQLISLKNELGSGKLIIEKYLSGQEYTIGVVGNERKYVLPIIGFPKDLGVRDVLIKKMEHKLRDYFEVIDEFDERFEGLLEIAVNTFDAVYARDILRIDLKEDHLGNVYVIDVNGTPALSLTGSLDFMASKVGLTYKHLVKLTLYESMVRYGLKPNGFFEEMVSEVRSKLIQYNCVEVA